MFVNNSQENIAKCLGVAWSQNKGHSDSFNGFQLPKRKTGLVAGQPGFYNCLTGGTISNASSQTITYNYFMNLARLNCISYSPTLYFGLSQDQASVNSNQNNGIILPIYYQNSHKMYRQNSSINLGQTYIYNTIFNSSLYTQFNSLYN
jgi:hypothetical protein